jgi:hypothetical protein
MGEGSKFWWDERVGPFYDARGAEAVTGLEDNDFRVRVHSKDLLMVQTLDGSELFPTFQFGERGELLPGLADVSLLLVPIVDDAWDVALWLVTRRDEFTGLRVVDELRAGHVADVLLIAARDGRILEN